VGMTRAHMADPHIVQKITQGREADIRPCVGATYCLDRIYQGGEALCIHNPSTGRERELPHHIPKAKTAKTVVVVGAGPGGLEAARVAAERGHHVHLIEAAPQAGGQVRLLTQSAHRREMISIIDWRLDQCTKLGVSMQFNTWADADTVLSYAPDVVIVATGGLPKMSLLERHDDLDHVVNSWDVLSGDVKLSGKVLIYDEAGDHAAQQAAQLALDSGCQVDLITPDRTLSADIMAMNLVPYLRSTQHKPIQHILAQRLLQIEPQGRQLRVTLGTDYSNHQRTADYDHIVFNAGTVPLAELYFDLKPLSRNGGEVDYDALITGNPQTLIKHPNSSFQLFRIGDAVSSRNIHAAVYDAMRLGVTL
ncbi:MAG: FAD-dependent oxidoreductase, partial [Gammaproteobacteria bacterium]|nr:FAD-dependent oxidoreductase [Gammaproteobacteria bacterium]